MMWNTNRKIDYNEIEELYDYNSVDEYYQFNDKKMNNKFGLALRSRTVWTVVAMFLVGGVGAVNDFIPAGLLPYVQGLLGVSAIWFKTHPAQNYE